MMNRRPFLAALFAAAALMASPSGFCQLTVEISGAGADRLPIAIAQFDGEARLPGSLSEVIRADLNRSGLFKLIEAGDTAANEAAIPDWSLFKSRGADSLLVGAVLSRPDGNLDVRFRLHDVVRQAQLDALSMSFRANQYRAAAHRIADIVYQRLVGEPGVFSTRVAYVVKTGPRYQLQIADSDGMNAQTALVSNEPIISPTWSPDGTRIAYVSFERKKPIVYVRNLASARPTVLANFKGSNSAPAWAPDGRRLALTLTKDGSSQIYLINADGSGLRRLTNSNGIDTEPTFSPDGQSIYFTSDRGGSPQIYRMAASGGAAQRVTFDGAYSVTPRVSPDGKTLAFISRNSGRFQLTVQDLASQQTQVLTDTAKDESPSFAPNGRTILYATEVGGRGVLATVSIDGRVRQRLSQSASDVREPTWAPLAR